MRALLGLCLGLSALGAACTQKVKLYDVTRTPVAECDILPGGEFCDPQLSPPVQHVVSVENREANTIVVFDDEVWVADTVDAGCPTDVDADLAVDAGVGEADCPAGNGPTLHATKEARVTRAPGCTTTTTALLRFRIGEATIVSEDGQQSVAESLLGSVETRTRLTGGDECGETPRGNHDTSLLLGPVTGFP
jgi:hypothetical protein